VTAEMLRKRNYLRSILQPLALVAATVVAGAIVAPAQSYFSPGNIVVSRSVYDNNPNNVQVGQILPPNCQVTQGGCSGPATYNGTYPYVWNNDLVDGSFGITSAIFLDQLTPTGTLVNTLSVPSARRIGQPLLADNLVTSFSSKSEVSLNLSADGQYLTFMGYVSSVDNLDVSNSNTPLVVDPTNPVGRIITARWRWSITRGSSTLRRPRRTAEQWPGCDFQQHEWRQHLLYGRQCR